MECELLNCYDPVLKSSKQKKAETISIIAYKNSNLKKKKEKKFCILKSALSKIKIRREPNRASKKR